jgi:hypothetical protein
MSDMIEEWFVEIAKNESFGLLDKIPVYTESHCSKMRNPRAERGRLVSYVRDYAPRTAFSAMILAAILSSSI